MNRVCGELEKEGAQLVLAYLGMLPVALRKDNRLNINAELTRRDAKDNPTKAKNVLREMVNSDRAGGTASLEASSR
eukprot:3765224-Prymnesium_polylepis.2